YWRLIWVEDTLGHYRADSLCRSSETCRDRLHDLILRDLVERAVPAISKTRAHIRPGRVGDHVRQQHVSGAVSVVTLLGYRLRWGNRERVGDAVQAGRPICRGCPGAGTRLVAPVVGQSDAYVQAARIALNNLTGLQRAIGVIEPEHRPIQVIGTQFVSRE